MNVGVNKVIYGGKTLIDLTGLSVTPETLLEGVTAVNAAGEIITGTMKRSAESAVLGTAHLGSMVLGAMLVYIDKDGSVVPVNGTLGVTN